MGGLLKWNCMPLYDYRCHKCGETFEVRQKFADELLKTHEVCGGELERLISAPALQFKGSGWYVNDYGRGGKLPAGETKESKPEAKSDGKSDAKPDSKSDGKSESKSTESKSESKSESKPAPAPASSSSDK